MPVASSRPVSNKNTKKCRSLRKATRMQAPNDIEEPFSRTQPLWDSLQFQSGANKVFGRVKKLKKAVAINFPRFGFRTGFFLQPPRAQRNVQEGHEHEDAEGNCEHKGCLPRRRGVATRRSLFTRRNISSCLTMGSGRVAAVSAHSGRHSHYEEELLSGTDGGPRHEIIFLQTALHQLEDLNTEAVNDLQNLALNHKSASGKTDSEVIEEAHSLTDNLVESVEAILSNLCHRIASAKSSGTHKRTTNHSKVEMKSNTVVESLRQSLNDLQHTVSEYFFQTITQLPSFFHEGIQPPGRVQASLQSLAFEYVLLHDRLCNAEQNMVNGIQGWTLAIKSTDQGETRIDNAMKLMEAASSNIIALQHKVLQTCSVQECENEVHLKETENLDLHLQLSWNWLQEVQNSIAILYPEKEKCLCDCFLSTLVILVEGIENHLKETGKTDQSSIDEVLFGVDLLCEKRVIALLTLQYNVYEQAMRRIQQNPALVIPDFVQIQNFCDHFVSLLTVLCSQLTSISASADAKHQSLTRARQYCKSKVLSLAEHHLQSNLYNIYKDSKAAKAVTTIVETLTQNMKNSEMKLLSHEVVLVNNSHYSSSSQAAIHEQEKMEHESSISLDVSNPGKNLSDHTTDLRGKARFPTPFANPNNRPMVSENLEDPSGNTEEEHAMDGSDFDLVRVEDTLLLDDPSLDLSFGSLASSGFSNRVHVDEVTEEKYLDEGSSGLVTRRKLNNLRVAVKESKCPDPDKRLKRLNREAKMHKKLNSCPNIVRYVGRLVKPNENGRDQIVGIITEWCELGDLFNAIRQAAQMQELDRDGKDISGMKDLIGYQLYKNWTKRLEIVVDIASAMVYMHKFYVVHRDLTCKNVLLYNVGRSGEFGAKVCDFERARYLPGGEDVPRTNSCANSAPWMGPEVLRNEYYGLKSDVYSIGTILWEFMYLQNPWTHLKERTGAHIATIQDLLSSGRTSLSISENDAPEDVPVFPQLVALVKSAWQADPEKRPTMIEFLCRLKQIISCMNSDIGT